MRYKTILVDDESLALQRLERLLQPHTELVEVIAHAAAGDEAVVKINALRPDLIFLDIQMPALNGFEVLERLQHLPWIIFSTAYDEYALRAFDANAIDYLLKPVEPERLQRALKKLQRLTSAEKQAWPQQLQQLLASVQPPTRKRLLVRVGDRVRFLPVREIYFFQAADKYVAAHTRDEVFLLDQTLNQLEGELPPEDFVRLHRSAIANLNHIAEAVRGFGGNYRVRMKDQHKTELPVSRQAKARLAL